jgi:hypothetical protein
VAKNISTSAEENYRARTTPPSFHRQKDDVGGLKHLDVAREKLWLQDLSPQPLARNGLSKGTMGHLSLDRLLLDRRRLHRAGHDRDRV